VWTLSPSLSPSLSLSSRSLSLLLSVGLCLCRSLLLSVAFSLSLSLSLSRSLCLTLSVTHCVCLSLIRLSLPRLFCRCILPLSFSVSVSRWHMRARLRVEFLLKTDSGCPKDTGVNKTWKPLGIPFAITPIGQLHQSQSSPIPGDLGRGPSHQSTCSNIETRMDRPKSVVRVIKGVAWTVHVNRLFIGSISGMYGIHYLRVFYYVSLF